LTSRGPTVVLSAAVLLALTVGLLARNAPSRGPGAPAAPRTTPAAPRPALAATPVDVAGLRDVFRFADEPARAPERRESAALRVLPTRGALSPPAGPRLVGVLRRAGRLVAALSLDGEVELAAPGETAAGVTVISVAEDGVRVRRADGSERLLVPPE
jgi:hypothetical protein